MNKTGSIMYENEDSKDVHYLQDLQAGSRR